jgi:ion channel-forming bestrophin family protein
MITSKSISIGKIATWSGHHMVWLLSGAGVLAFAYKAGHVTLSIPWLPISVIGTAVAFYVGFKNNQAFDRMWEARKIWGVIVNNSRTWGMYVDGYITGQFANGVHTEADLKQIKQRLIYRHIAWLYALRSQLLIATPWEHISQGGLMGRTAKYYQKKFGVGLIDDDATRNGLKHYLPDDEYERLIAAENTATQIINEQSRDLKSLRAADVIEDFRHMEMMQVLSRFYEEQGKCERIKKFPLPRQYAYMSRVFVGIFIALLPFSMIPELMKSGNWGFWLSIPITALIGWVYVMMEIVGDYTENPFQGMANDIPMLSLTRTIEIDLRQMLGETDLPKAIVPVKDVLM